MVEWSVNLAWHALLGLFMLGVLSLLISCVANVILLVLRAVRN